MGNQMNRALLVIDDTAFQETFRHLARESGFEIDTTTSLRDLRHVLAEHAYPVVIVDFASSKTGLDGLLQLCQHLAQLGSSLIVLVAPDDDETACELIKGGASHCLARTVPLALLLHEVRHSFEYQQLRYENSELHAMNTLLQTSQDLSRCLDPVEVFQLLAHALIREIGAARAIGFVKDGEQFSALTDQCGDTYVTPLLTEQIGLLLQQHIPHSSRVVRFVMPPELHGSAALDLREALVIPLLSHSAVLGCVVLFNNVGQLLPPIHHDRPVVFLQEQGARALEHAFRFTATRDLLFVDELTGLFNYRYLKTALEREIKRADRYATQLTVMFLDLDNFKGVNDTYGHMVGSGVLRELGALLKKAVREVDVLIRYGGDEYTILLVESGPEQGQRIGERIRKQIEANAFMTAEGYDIRLTASIGFASYPDDTTGMQELLNMADQAMYVGKASGKNCVFRVASPLAGAGRLN
jgi:diguanylate cyclase (GGDEF)-like protein